MKLSVCVDFDGTITSWTPGGWKGVDHFGEPFPGAQEFLKKLREKFKVVIFTCRCNVELLKEPAEVLRDKVAAYMDQKGLEYDEIYIGQGKPVATAYIDDRAISCNPAAGNSPDVSHYDLALFCLDMLIETIKTED